MSLTSSAPCTVSVVSMGRSGTSLVSRLLAELLAVSFGDPQEHLAADSANPDGYYELRDLVEFNDRVLREISAGIANPPPLGFYRQADAHARQEWVREARQIVDRHRTAAPRFGFKDPRVALLFPIWHEVFPEQRCVVMFRHPLSVARSAAAQLGVEASAVLPLWREYYRRIFIHTRDCPRLLVSFEALLATPEREFDRLAKFVGVADSSVPTARLGEFIKPRQSQHSLGESESAARNSLDGETLALFTLLRQCHQSQRFPSDQELTNVLR